MLRTPLTEWHRAAGARLVDFAGWEMPLSYTGVIDEHETVRRSAGLFDISHMGRIAVEGPAAEAVLQRVVTRDLARMADGSARYALACNDAGGVLDDVVVYRRAPQRFFVVVNASNRPKMLAWFQRQAAELAPPPAGLSGAGEVQIWDLSDAIAMIAVQGPSALAVLEPMASVADGTKVTKMKRWTVKQAVVAGADLLLATTGYTGEPGVELFVESGKAVPLWEALLLAGKPAGIKPIGLGARDTLRLEMGYSLYGHELDETISPLEAGLGWAVDLDAKEFIGRQALLAQQQTGLSRQMTAFALPDRAVPRQGYRLLRGNEAVGVVTSGNVSPMLQRGIGLGFLPPEVSRLGDTVGVEIRNRLHPATIVPLPFYKGVEGGHA
ncbi:MAG TPA: glycine cleavage system aminomethyltransferase GcvT [Nitrospiria bacterium]|nr:glycine cleavage system aminomethyltransferase GcvT [Nitrospiria bacterium]